MLRKSKKIRQKSKNQKIKKKKKFLEVLPEDNFWPNFVKIRITVAEKSNFNGRTPDDERRTTDAKWFLVITSWAKNPLKMIKNAFDVKSSFQNVWANFPIFFKFLSPDNFLYHFCLLGGSKLCKKTFEVKSSQNYLWPDFGRSFWKWKKKPKHLEPIFGLLETFLSRDNFLYTFFSNAKRFLKWKTVKTVFNRIFWFEISQFRRLFLLKL